MSEATTGSTRESGEPLLPPHLIVLLRQEVPGLCDEIVNEISRGVPEYQGLISGRYRGPVQEAVLSNVFTFVDQLATPSLRSPARDKLCRELGELQAPSENGLSLLESAIRIGVRVAWRRALMVFRRHRVPDPFHYVLADLLFGYVDELTGLAREGYRRALAECSRGSVHHRHHLSRQLLTGHADRDTILRLADLAGWALPHEVTVLAAGRGAMTDGERLDDDVLLDTTESGTVLVVPGPLKEQREQMLTAAVHRATVAAGPTLSLSEAAESLGFAMRTLRLAEAGVIGDGQRLVRSDDHLLTLWVSAEPRLGERLGRQQLVCFDALPPGRRRRMLETLSSWLETHGDAHAMGLALGLHPQTVRYRIRALRALVGPAIDDAEWRIRTELGLRARRLAELR